MILKHKIIIQLLSIEYVTKFSERILKKTYSLDSHSIDIFSLKLLTI